MKRAYVIRAFAIIIISITAVLALGYLAVIMLKNLFYIPDRNLGKHVIIRLNAESNIKGDDEDYVLWVGNQIILYSFETGETTEYHLESTEAAGRSGLVIGTGMYSVIPDGTIRRFYMEKQSDEEILSKEDLCSMCGLTYLPNEFDVSIRRTRKNLLLMIDGHDEEELYYICPIDGELKTDCVEVNSLFPKEDKTGREQSILYRGMRIRRSYDAEKKKYQVIELGEKDGRPEIFNSAPKDTATIRVAGKLISLGHQRNNMSNWVEEGSEERRIGCLNESVFDFSVIQPDKLMTENGEIIGLVHAIRNYTCDSWNPSQDELRYDVLFWFDPKTEKDGILYSPWNNRSRIIGYQDGVIYLLKDYKIYTRTVENEKEKLVVELPSDTNYMFDWQGDYLIVIRQDSIYGAFKVR